MCSSSHLAGAHRAPVAVQHPDLPAVLDLVVMDTVTGAVVPVGAAAVVASLQVEAHCVVGTGVPPRLAFINICREQRGEEWHHAYAQCAGNNVLNALFSGSNMATRISSCQRTFLSPTTMSLSTQPAQRCSVGVFKRSSTTFTVSGENVRYTTVT